MNAQLGLKDHNKSLKKKRYRLQGAKDQPDEIKTEVIVKATLKCNHLRLVPSDLSPVLHCKVFHWKNSNECHHLLNILANDSKSQRTQAVMQAWQHL